MQGLGKTVISLACVLAAPQEPAVTAAKKAAYSAAIAAATTPAAKKKVIIPTHATLVVCAVSLVGQWCAEVQSKVCTRWVWPCSVCVHLSLACP